MEANQAVEKAVKQTVARFLAHKSLRSYKAEDGRDYVLDMELRADTYDDGRDATELVVTTWGFDGEGLVLPKTWAQMVGCKVLAMLGIGNSIPSQVASRFYWEIFKAADKLASN